MDHDVNGGMDLESAARALGVHYQTAYHWIRTGLLPAVKIGGEYRVSPEEVARLAESRQASHPLSYTGRRRDWERLGEQFYEAFLTGDETGARRVFERLRLARVPLADQCEQLLAPALRRIGDEWAAGIVSGARLRVAAGIAERMLAWAVSCLDDPPLGAPLAVVVTPKGDDHHLPALMAGSVLRDGNWAVRHIHGLTTGEVVDLARRSRPALVVVSFALGTVADAAAEVSDDLVAALGTPVLVGGPAEPLNAVAEHAGLIRRARPGGCGAPTDSLN